MKLIQKSLYLLFFWSSLAHSSEVSIAVISGGSKSHYEVQTQPYLDQQIKVCGHCTLTNLTPYDSQGNFVKDLVAQQIIEAGQKHQILFLNWNDGVTPENKPIVEALSAQDKLIIVGFGGVAEGNNITLPLNRTVLGQAGTVILIGEMTKRQILAPGSHFGPEFLTAIKASDQARGNAGLSVFPFVVQLGKQFKQREPSSWREHFTKTKVSSRKLWPEIFDFFKMR